MTQPYALVLNFDAESKEASAVVEPKFFRPNRFYTLSTAEGQGFIDGIYIGDENQLVGDTMLDSWLFSAHRVDAERKAFFEEHGLLGKSLQEVQIYLDDNELQIPDVLYLDMPSLKQGDRLKMTGSFPGGMMITFLGLVP